MVRVRIIWQLSSRKTGSINIEHRAFSQDRLTGMSKESDNESFHSARNEHTASITDDQSLESRLPAEEETSLLKESNNFKATANSLFAQGSFDSAIQIYEKALASCPAYLEYEIAVLHANIAACYLKVQNWREAIASASSCLECLNQLCPLLDAKSGPEGTFSGSGNQALVEEVDDATAERIEALRKSCHTQGEVQKIKAKGLLRRAKARLEAGGWANLQGADEDYKLLLLMPDLSAPDRQTVKKALVILPSRLEKAKQTEMSEMMTKLKDLGNGILKPFGLSTNNFNFVKDEDTGGYSMQFNQNGSKST